MGNDLGMIRGHFVDGTKKTVLSRPSDEEMLEMMAAVEREHPFLVPLFDGGQQPMTMADCRVDDVPLCYVNPAFCEVRIVDCVY